MRILGLPLALGLAAALVAVPGPSHAAVTGATQVDDLVLYSHCQRHAIDYTVAVPEGTTFWRLTVQVLDPDGHTSEGNPVNSTTSDGSGTFKVRFCGSETPGTYTVRATGFTEVVPLVHIPFSLPNSTFEVRRAPTTTKLSQQRARSGRHLLTVLVRERTNSSSRRPDGTTVRIQRRVDGAWANIRGARLETFNGRATTRLHSKPGTRLRAVTVSAGNYARSTSRPLTLR